MNAFYISILLCVFFCRIEVHSVQFGAEIDADVRYGDHIHVRADEARQNSLPRTIQASFVEPAKPRREPIDKVPISDATNNVLTVARQNSASKFADLVQKTSWLLSTLTEGSGDVTLFAFSDDAYSKSSAAVKTALDTEGERDQILQYHVALGTHYSKDIVNFEKDTALYSLFPSPPFKATSKYQPIHVDAYLVPTTHETLKVVTASGAPVIKTDLMASNGVVHILDKVMYPVPTGADMARALEEEPNYSSLYAALQAANLTSALSTPAFKPLTLLAPSNAAFAKLTPAQQELLKNTTILKKVLTFHVVAGSFYSAAVYENFQLHSLERSTIYFEKGAGGVFAEGQKLVNFDWTVTNGVIHELAGVMFPRHMHHLFYNEA